jgi:tetratricopeptide (TPR) repeat protein
VTLFQSSQEAGQAGANVPRKRAILLAVAWVAIAAAPHERAAFETLGVIGSAVEDVRHDIFVTLENPHLRFRVPAQPPEKRRSLLVILNGAREAGTAVHLRFDGNRGRVDPKAGTVDYPLCAVLLDDLVFEPETRCAAADEPRLPSGEAALTLGMAQLAAGKTAAAASLLARAGSSPNPAFRKLLLNARADAAEGLAWTEVPGSEKADRQWLAALTDHRAEAELSPDDIEIQLSIGQVLDRLGAYDEARTLYERQLSRHPDEEYRLRVRIGAIYRQQGDQVRALDQLNQLVAHNGPQTGMRYHYHRGWTLTRLKRFDEAVAEFTQGMKEQPDYAWAYLRRSCAYASLGEIDDARKDMAQAIAQMESDLRAYESPTLRFDLQRARIVAAELDTASRAGSHAPLPDTCRGFWGADDEARPRSPLLPSA